MVETNENLRAAKLNVGRLLSAVALIFCVPLGALFVSIATGFVGIFLGITGYALGARRLGALAVVLCTAAMFVGHLLPLCFGWWMKSAGRYRSPVM